MFNILKLSKPNPQCQNCQKLQKTLEALIKTQCFSIWKCDQRRPFSWNFQIETGCPEFSLSLCLLPHQVCYCPNLRNCLSSTDLSADFLMTSRSKLFQWESSPSFFDIVRVSTSSTLFKQISECRKCLKLYSFSEFPLNSRVVINWKHCTIKKKMKTSNFKKFFLQCGCLHISPSSLTVPKVPAMLQFFWNDQIFLNPKIKFPKTYRFLPLNCQTVKKSAFFAQSNLSIELHNSESFETLHFLIFSMDVPFIIINKFLE